MTNHSAQHPSAPGQLGLMHPTTDALVFEPDPVDRRQYIGVFDARDTIDLRVMSSGRCTLT